jgi:hypothetical protein
LHLVAKAVAAFGAVLLVYGTALAHAALIADVLVAVEAYTTVRLVISRGIGHALATNAMVDAGVARCGIGLVSGYEQALAALLALRFGAVRTVLVAHTAVTLHGAFAEEFVAIAAGIDVAGFDEFDGTIVVYVLVKQIVDAFVVLSIVDASIAELAMVLAIAVHVDIFRAAAAVAAEEVFGSGLGLGRVVGVDNVLVSAFFAPGNGFAPRVGPLPIPGIGLQEREQCNGQGHCDSRKC